MDGASLILSALALGFAAGALWCTRRAFAAHGARAKFAWAGRALALAGGGVAIWFPAELYGELAMVAPRGSDDVLWLPNAIWYQLALMPLTVVPALVALRWPRAAGALFVANVTLTILAEFLRPFGVIFPDASHDVATYLFEYGPPALTALLLLAGQDRPAFPEPLSGRYLTLGPVS